MKSLRAKQCVCGSKAFLGRRCALCNERLPDSLFETSPRQKVLSNLLKSPIFHLAPPWLVYAGLILVSEAVWIPNKKHAIPAVVGGILLGFLSVGYIGAPAVAYLRGRGMRMPSQSEQKVAVALIRYLSLALMIIMTAIMLTGRIPLVMK